jgi:ABC-2 type transport system ATP-binding protein
MSRWGTEQVTVTYGDVPALEEVDVAVTAGSITSVVGGDGAGKTTLSRLLAGLVRPSSGAVRRPSRREIGYQSESSGVWRDLTVDENLAFVASAHRLSRADRISRTDLLLDVTALGPARDRLAGELSGGMRQKLGVAMALLPDPKLLLLDEPTTGLDPVSRTELWAMVAKAAAEGTAVLTTTTYLDEAERASAIVALDEGRVLAHGTVADVRAATPGVVAVVDPATSAGFTWRRGAEWRAWFPDGALPAGARSIEPDLSDLVVVAALRSRAA